MKKRLLLISNSFYYGKGYLDHCADEIIDFLVQIKTVLFIPYALKDHDRYESIAKARFKKIGINLISIHKQKNIYKAVKEAESIFIGGGNTFRLLNSLYKHKLIKIIKEKVEGGVPYIGTSAGANVACPSIKTTNDMPIIQPPSFAALNLVPFQINPHYIDPDPNSKHMGETREKRIQEFHEENNTPVIGLREGSWLRIKNNEIRLKGKTGAKIFVKGSQSKNYKKGDKLNFLCKYPIQIKPPVLVEFKPPVLHLSVLLLF